MSLKGGCLSFVYAIDLDLAFSAAFLLPSCCFLAFPSRRMIARHILVLIAVFEEEFYSLIRAHLFAHISSFSGTFLTIYFYLLFPGIRIWHSEETS